MSLPFLLWLCASTAAFLTAATASRTYIATSNVLFLVLSLGLYCIGNLMMIRLMREGGLALAISISAVVQLLLINVIAVSVFGERLPALQLLGVATGVVAMALMMFPGTGKV